LGVRPSKGLGVNSPKQIQVFIIIFDRHPRVFWELIFQNPMGVWSWHTKEKPSAARRNAERLDLDGR
jgi:hypothetical protein